MRSDDRRPGSGGYLDRAVPHGPDAQYRFALIQGARTDLGFTRDRRFKRASRVNPTCMRASRSKSAFTRVFDSYALHPSFETAASQPPQDEGGGRGANLVCHHTQIPSEPPASPRSVSANSASSGSILLIMPCSKV